MLKALASNLFDAANGPSKDYIYLYDGVEFVQPPVGEVYKGIYSAGGVDSVVSFTTLSGTSMVDVVIPKGTTLYCFITSIEDFSAGNAYGIL